MSTAVFDTHAYIKKMRSAGFTEEQAEIQAEAMSEIIDDKLATKRDIEDLSKKMENMEYRLIIKLGSIMVIGIGVIAALSKLH